MGNTERFEVIKLLLKRFVRAPSLARKAVFNCRIRGEVTNVYFIDNGIFTLLVAFDIRVAI
ncbi:hypothetical protein D3C72_1883110 [compost metagenome]